MGVPMSEHNDNQRHHPYGNSHAQIRTLGNPSFSSLSLDNAFDDECKYFNDPVHASIDKGYIKMMPYAVDIIDTPHFQRLRELKQLGSSYYVFPGASHNRFEHCLGVSHLARQMVQQLCEKQPELEIDERDVRCITLAGLCHDLGHGPFSHLFDGGLIPIVKPGIKWRHEDASEMMLEHLIDENNIDIDRDDINFIKDLITGTPKSGRQEKAFLFDIVANKRNAVDVDKFDYIQRDCYNVGLKSSYDYTRLMIRSRVIDDQICYHHKEVYNLFEMFHTRFSLFKQIYTHRAAAEIELMIIDAMVAADPVLKLSEAIYSPKDYLYLTDNILTEIERSKDSQLAEAQRIIRRIRYRDLYKFVDEFIIPHEFLPHINENTVKPEHIVNFQDPNDGLKPSDVVISWNRIHYGTGQKNPIENIRFFSQFDLNKSFHIPSDKISLCVPAKFEENSMLVFARDTTKRKAIQKAARKFMSKANVNYASSSLSVLSTAAQLAPQQGDTLPGQFDVSPKKRKFSISSSQ